MGMIEQGLAPGVEHCNEADLRAQMFGVRSNGAQRLCGRPEEDGIDYGLILIGDRGDLVRYGKDDVEVFDREQLRPAVLQPLGLGQRLTLRTVTVAAGVIGDAVMGTVVTLL